MSDKETDDKIPTDDVKRDANGKPIDSDYYAWSKKMKETKETLEKLGVDCKPKKLDTPAVEENKPVVGSVWNKAGTWEEKDCLKWAKQKMDELFVGQHFKYNDMVIKISSLETCDGTATIVFSKGKKKPGYDLNLKFKWKATELINGEEGTITAEGTISCPEFCDLNDGDNEWSIKADKSDTFHTKARNHLKSSQNDIVKVMNAWVDCFKSL